MITAKERAQWVRVYDLVDKLEHLGAWDWMGPNEYFGVWPHGYPEPYLVVMTGHNRATRSIRLLQGWQNFFYYMGRLNTRQDDDIFWLREVAMLELSFLKTAELYAHEKQHLKEFGRVPDAQGYMAVLRSIYSGYHPWIPTVEELDVFETTLYQTYGMCMRVEADESILEQPQPPLVFVLRQAKDGTWSDVWTPVIFPQPEAFNLDLDGILVHYLRTHTLASVTLQLDVVGTPILHAEAGERIPLTYLLLMVDGDGEILIERFLQPLDGIVNMWSTIPAILLEAFKKLGGCPATIEVRSQRVIGLLQPLCEFLPFKLVHQTQLKVLEHTLTEVRKRFDALD